MSPPPPNQARRGGDEAGVHVRRRHARAAQVGHQRDAGGEEARIGLGAGDLGAELGRELAVHGGDVDADLLEHAAAAQQAHHPAAALAGLRGTGPRRALEAARREGGVGAAGPSRPRPRSPRRRRRGGRAGSRTRRGRARPGGGRSGSAKGRSGAGHGALLGARTCAAPAGIPPDCQLAKLHLICGAARGAARGRPGRPGPVPRAAVFRIGHGRRASPGDAGARSREAGTTHRMAETLAQPHGATAGHGPAPDDGGGGTRAGTSCTLTTGAFTAVGVGALVVALHLSMNPSRDVLALSTTEVDLSPIAVGSAVTVVWRGKPVFVRHRTADEIKEARDTPLSELPDPEPDQSRVKKDEWLVLVGVCTHLGCVPLGQKPSDARGEFRRLVLPLPRQPLRHLGSHPAGAGAAQPRGARLRVHLRHPDPHRLNRPAAPPPPPPPPPRTNQGASFMAAASTRATSRTRWCAGSTRACRSSP